MPLKILPSYNCSDLPLLPCFSFGFSDDLPSNFLRWSFKCISLRALFFWFFWSITMRVRDGFWWVGLLEVRKKKKKNCMNNKHLSVLMKFTGSDHLLAAGIKENNSQSAHGFLMFPFIFFLHTFLSSSSVFFTLC